MKGDKTTYQELYDLYQKYKWADVDLFGLRRKWKIEKKFGDLFRADLDTIHGEIYPRRRIIKHSNIPTETIEATREKWQKRALAWYTCVLGRVAYLKRKMLASAVAVELVPQLEMHVLKEVSSSEYRSQGRGAHKYAKGSAQIDVDLLVSCGFDAEIQSQRPFEDSDLTHYRVYADALPWQLDVCRRRGGSMFDHCVGLWKRGINPKVYYPFLDDDVFDRSCDIAMGVVKE